MALSTQPYKGARDFYPEDKRLQKYLFSVMRQVVETYGYEEYDAPILEPTELFASKTSDEIVNEQTYTFTDRGDRSVTIRTEMTPSVSRMVAAKRQDLAYPIRWYSIPNLWRYERPQRGRLREFWQLNVDLFGVPGVVADHETIQVADAVMHAFGAKRDMYIIKVNNRKLVNQFMSHTLQLDEEHALSLIRLVDRMHKMDAESFDQKAKEVAGLSDDAMATLREFLAITDIHELDTSEPASELQQLIKLLKSSGVNNVVYDPTLMRGFDYYTDMVFEVFDLDPENNRAMFGGGRYDGLVGLFGVEPIPTIGFAMGDVPLQNFLESHKLLPVLAAETNLRVILVGDVYEQAQPVLTKIREQGINVAVDMTGRKADKQIKAAVKSGVDYVLFIGQDEIDSGTYKLRNLATSNEVSVTIEQLVSNIKQ